MSYKKKKLKTKKLNRLKFKVELVWRRLFYKKIKQKKERREMIPIQNVTRFMRERSRMLKTNSLKVNEWTDIYLTTCSLNGKTVNILTQWCLSKALEKRFKEQGNKFVPLKKEIRVIRQEIPEIISVFNKNGFSIDWLITFNRSPVETGLLPGEVETAYKEMILALADDPAYQKNVVFLDWEDDVLGRRTGMDRDVLENYFTYVSRASFEKRLEQLTQWSRDEAGVEKTRDELTQDIILEAACEAEEARTLSGKDSPFGGEDFIILPLETAERFDNFTIFEKDFKKRVVSVLTQYPWRVT